MAFDIFLFGNLLSSGSSLCMICNLPRATALPSLFVAISVNCLKYLVPNIGHSYLNLKRILQKLFILLYDIFWIYLLLLLTCFQLSLNSNTAVCTSLKAQSCKLKKHRQMIAYMFQSSPENFTFLLFVILE